MLLPIFIYFCFFGGVPVGAGIFLAGNPFLEIFFVSGGVSFSTLEAILLYISSNVYRIDPKKRTLRTLKGYKIDFSQDIHITIQKK